MKIVILDGYTLNPGDLDWTGFEALGEVTCYDRTAAGDIRGRVGDAEAVIVNKTPLDAALIADCPKLRYIGVLATGYNVVDVAAAKAHNVIVTNIPTYGTTAVAQHTIALLLEICLHVGEHDRSVHAGEWSSNVDWCYWKHPLIELAGKTMGIIGFGKIGQNTARIAQALGMNILAYDQYQDASLVSPTLRYVSLDELLAQSDVITLHCPLFPETQGIINQNTIAKTKRGVIILNTARGPLVVESDVALGLHSGQIGYFAADVVSTEPIAADNPLLSAPNCLLTPHIAWAPLQSRARLMNIAVENLKNFVSGNPTCVVS